MRDFIDLLARVRGHPLMYVNSGSYAEVAALLAGFDMARDGGPLRGFREWLIARVDAGNNLAWDQLVLMHVFPDDPVRHRVGSLQLEHHKVAVEGLIDLATEFLRDREDHRKGGLRRIYLDYEAWLRRQSWYTSDSPHYVEFSVGNANRRG